MRSELGIKPGDFAILSVGDLNKNKNQIVLIEAMKYLPNHVKLILAGDGPLYNRLLCRVKELGVADRVVFLGFRHDIPALLNACDLFCMPSLREGLPVSLIEAIATGTPCLTSSARGCEDVLGSFSSECIIRDNRPDAWAESIMRILVSGKSPNLGFSLRALAEKYAVDACVARLSEVYGSILWGEAV